jgi:hypothetical protein
VVAVTRPAPPPGAGDEAPEFARADAVAGLAREIEALRRSVEPLLPVSDRVNELAGLLAHVTDVVAALSARPAASPAPSWLMLPTEEFTARRLLGELTAWLHAIFLRYPDGAAGLPECWLYHPDVVEELLWLMHAWSAAYQGPGASVALAGEWHERSRPAVVRRIKLSAGACSIERHQTRPGWDQRPTGAAPVPGMESVEVIARWWAAARDDPAPEPAARPVNGVSLR